MLFYLSRQIKSMLRLFFRSEITLSHFLKEDVCMQNAYSEMENFLYSGTPIVVTRSSLEAY